MRAGLLGLLLALLLVVTDGPRRFAFDPGRISTAAALADNSDRDDDDDDEDDDDRGDDEDAPDDDDREDDNEEGDEDTGRRIDGKGGSARRTNQMAGELVVTRGPYLQMVTPTGMTIRWRTSAATRSWVRYGPSPNDLSSQVEEPGSTTEHEVRLADLRPATRYYYAIGMESAALAGGPEFTFMTAPPVGAERKVRIWLIGDSGLPGKAQQRVRAAYDAHSDGAPTDVWLLVGDNAYSAGTDAQYQAGFFGPYRERLRSTVLWPSRGNHDQTRKGLGNDYYDFFTLPQRGECGGIPSGTEAYYSFDYANIHFVCLDAEKLRGAGTAMIDWLRSDLAATQQDWIIAYWHHPPYSKGSHDSDKDPVMTQARERILPVLEAGGADLVLCGHSHSYERSRLLDRHYGTSASLERSMLLDQGTGDPRADGPYQKRSFGSPFPHEGTVYAVVGSSSKLTDGPLDHRAHAKSLMSLGSLSIEVLGNRLDAAFINDQGRVADRFTIVKGDGRTVQREDRADGTEPDAGSVSRKGSR